MIAAKTAKLWKVVKTTSAIIAITVRTGVSRRVPRAARPTATTTYAATPTAACAQSSRPTDEVSVPVSHRTMSTEKASTPTAPRGSQRALPRASTRAATAARAARTSWRTSHRFHSKPSVVV